MSNKKGNDSQKSDIDKQIIFHANFAKAMTAVDGSWKVTLDLAEGDSAVVAVLASLKNFNLRVTVEIAQD